MHRLLVHSLLLFAFSMVAMAGPEVREAPNMGAAPADQLVVAGNACGPAALMNAFRFGNKDWQRASDAIAGNNDRERILRIIREIGMRPSKHTPGRARWSRCGVSLADLRDMADEMCMGKYLPNFSEEVFFLKGRETPEKLLRRVHQRFGKSLEKGLPPVVSLRRYAMRSVSGKAAQWVVVDAHFVTLVSIPGKLDKGARSFPVSYIDPWGGKRCEGTIAIPERRVIADPAGNSSCLEAVFPKSQVGIKQVRKGEQTVLVPAAALGRW